MSKIRRGVVSGAFIGLLLTAACLQSDVTRCASGRLCPADSVCSIAGDRCLFGGECGDGKVDGVEACDDGNTLDGDGCSVDCTSTEVCGNGIADFELGESCDGTTVRADCLSVGFDYGALRCSQSCDFDDSECGVIGLETSISAPGLSLDAITALPTGEMFTAGARSFSAFNQALHFDGETWSAKAMPLDAVTCLLALASDDVLACGSIPFSSESMAHFDGETWSLVAAPAVMTDFFRAPGGEVFAFGRTGPNFELFRYEDGVFTPHFTDFPSGAIFNAGWASAANEVYLAYQDFSLPAPSFGIYDGVSFSPIDVGLAKYDAATVVGIDGTAPDNLFVVTHTPAGVLYFDGTQWTELIGIEAGGIPIRGVAAYGPKQAVAFGLLDSASSLIMISGESVRTISIPQQAVPTQIWAWGADRVELPIFGELASYRGSGFRPAPLLVEGTQFVAAAARGSLEFSVVGPGGTAIHSDGLNWLNSCQLSDATQSSQCQGVERNLLDVWSQGDNFYAVGEGGTILDAGVVVPVPITESLYSIDGLSSEDLYVVGDGGTLLHRDALGWKAITTGIDVDLRAVAVGDEQALAVGAGGTILRATGGGAAIEELLSPTTGNLLDIVTTSQGVSYAVGTEGAFLKIEGQSITAIEGFRRSDTLIAVTGIRADDVFIASSTQLFHYDGEGVSPVRLPKSMEILDLAQNDQDLLIVTSTELHRLERVTPW